MKKFNGFGLLLGIVLATCNVGYAQLVVPDQSPFATVSQKIGFDEVTVEYSRPSVRGRIIFGGLVPYGEMWCLGANASTKIFVREILTIEDQYKLMPGIYSVSAIPGKDEWTIIFNNDAWMWGLFRYQSTLDALRIKVKPQQLKEKVETLTIQFANVCASCAEVQILWDFTRVSFRISTASDDKVMTEIKTFTSNPEGRLAGEYYLAAKYYLDTDRDLKQALEWIDKALKYTPGAYWMTNTKAQIYAKMEDYNKAIETANLSIEEARAKQSDDYVRINEQDIARWKELKKSRHGSN